MNLFYQNTISSNNITELYLHHNEITFTNRNFAGFTNLRMLDLDSNQLTIFELQSSDTPNLQTLNLRSNSLSVMPVFIGQLHSLETLDLERNAIENIQPNDFENITNITNLDLSYNKIIAFKSHAELSYLGELNLAHNSLVQVPYLAGHYSSPVTLNIEHNNISTKSMLQLKMNFNTSNSALRTLNLGGNPDFVNNISEVIDYIIKNFPDVGHIGLPYSNIKELPILRSNNVSKISLSFSGNQISDISFEEWEIISQFNEFRLNLNYNPVNGLPNLLPYLKPDLVVELLLNEAKMNCDDMCWMLETG